MPCLSIVIPCVREPSLFEATLASVLQNRPEDCEVMVVQPRAYDDPYGLKGEVRFVEARADASLVELINAGVEQASAEVVHLLSCDVEVREGWTQPALRRFHDPTIGSVASLVVGKDDPTRLVSRGVRYGSGGVRQVCRAARAGRRRRGIGVVAPTLASGMYRRQAVLDAGGFCSDLGADFSDVDLGLKLQAAGYRCVPEQESVVVTELGPGAPQLSFANGRAAEKLFWRHAAPSNWVCSFLSHPAVWLAECICNLYRPQIVLQAMGRVQGWLERGSQGPQRRQPQTSDDQTRQRIVPLAPNSKPERGRPLNSRAAA